MNQSSALVRVQVFAAIVEVTPIVEVCVPQAIVDGPLKHVFLDQLAQELLNTGDVGEGGISHHAEQVLDFVRSGHVTVEIEALVALQDSVYHCCVLAVD